MSISYQQDTLSCMPIVRAEFHLKSIRGHMINHWRHCTTTQLNLIGSHSNYHGIRTVTSRSITVTSILELLINDPVSDQSFIGNVPNTIYVFRICCISKVTWRIDLIDGNKGFVLLINFFVKLYIQLTVQYGNISQWIAACYSTRTNRITKILQFVTIIIIIKDTYRDSYKSSINSYKVNANKTNYTNYNRI